MKLQELISGGFAITAIAAASVPAIGWSLLGDGAIERPVIAVQSQADMHPFLMADASLRRVVWGAGAQPRAKATVETAPPEPVLVISQR